MYITHLRTYPGGIYLLMSEREASWVGLFPINVRKGDLLGGLFSIKCPKGRPPGWVILPLMSEREASWWVYSPLCVSLRGVGRGISSHMCLPEGCGRGKTSHICLPEGCRRGVYLPYMPSPWVWWWVYIPVYMPPWCTQVGVQPPVYMPASLCTGLVHRPAPPGVTVLTVGLKGLGLPLRKGPEEAKREVSCCFTRFNRGFKACF